MDHMRKNYLDLKGMKQNKMILFIKGSAIERFA